MGKNKLRRKKKVDIRPDRKTIIYTHIQDYELTKKYFEDILKQNSK